MKMHDFLATIQKRGNIQSKEQAEKVSRATLEILSQRLAGDEPQNLAAQLPHELQPALGKTGGREQFSLDQFYQKVADNAGISKEDARRYSHAVLNTVTDAVADGEMEDIFSQLPDEYLELIGSRQTG